MSQDIEEKLEQNIKSDPFARINSYGALLLPGGVGRSTTTWVSQAITQIEALAALCEISRVGDSLMRIIISRRRSMAAHIRS
ncbi:MULTISPECIES: hypothetical protein [Klebsiella/Raoultella group]|uniref:hypothetical protein n=1 Tax=Klebsiella/Raoultella group TaxID=2890311 RepID=UPI001C60EBC6|nr:MULTISPECIES: hypothetical protein [Klebsiella/Raoultella group]MCS5990881.1 hypothetical protein [Klebsiella variicola subsp. variicola]